jgi:hypothetical protein
MLIESEYVWDVQEKGISAHGERVAKPEYEIAISLPQTQVCESVLVRN